MNGLFYGKTGGIDMIKTGLIRKYDEIFGLDIDSQWFEV